LCIKAGGILTILAKQIISDHFSRFFGALVFVAALAATVTAQSITPAQMLRVKQVSKPQAAGSQPWTIEVENTSKNSITAYGLTVTCRYPGGATKQTEVAFDLVPLLAGHAGILASVEYLRSAKPELNLAINRGNDLSFAPGVTRRETYFPPSGSNGVAPDSISTTPVTVILDNGRAAGDSGTIASIFFGRNDELKKRTLLIQDLHAIEASNNPAGTFDERLHSLATAPIRPAETPKLLPGQTQILIDQPESRRNWQQEQLSLLRRQFNSMDRARFKAVVLQFEAEAAVYACLSKYAVQ
jgi:hypothetical protein